MAGPSTCSTSSPSIPGRKSRRWTRPRRHADRPGRHPLSAGCAAGDAETQADALQRLRRQRHGHERRQDRLRPHHHVRPLSLQLLQRLARRQAEQGPSRVDADVSGRHPERPGLLPQRRRPAGLRDDDGADPLRHHRAGRGLAHPPGARSTPTASTRPWKSSRRATTACTPTNGCWPTSRPTRSPCSSWARTRASSIAAARTNGSAAPRAFTGAATTPRICKSAWRRSPASRTGRPSRCFGPRRATRNGWPSTTSTRARSTPISASSPSPRRRWPRITPSMRSSPRPTWPAI